MIKSLVLIIENDQSVIDILVNKLEQIGCAALQASSAEEAKNLLLDEKLQPILVFCNTRLPDMSGLDFFRLTLKNNLNLSICMLCSKSDRNVIIEALQLGALEFINLTQKSTLSVERLGRLIEFGRKKAAIKNCSLV